jgi:asparagine synthase (glutamine-hydrolysing)
MESYLDRLQTAIAHRGPDGSGRYTDENWAFLNVRLAIVDVSSGAQPIFSDDRSIGIVYNGEVYNYKELKKELEACGITFRTNSDTEVVLRAYEVYGLDSFAKLNGMFAFCIWDNKKGEAYIVRDRAGIKPIYIYEDNTKLICCSEFKGIAAVPDTELSLNPLGIQDYVRFRYVQAPYTLFKNVRCLEAGTFLKVKNGRATQYRYWDVDYKEPYPPIDPGAAVALLEEKFQNAVASQLMGEVPIGVLLSGGVDSSAIAHYVHSCGADLSTFNIGFPNLNEFEYSRAVAKNLGLKHIEIMTTADELVQLFDEVVMALDHPIADPACLPLYRLGQELKEHVTVVLSGEGGDELFAGYTQYSFVSNSDAPYRERFRQFLERSWYFSDYEEFLVDPTLPPTTLRYWKYFDELSLLNGMLSYDMKTWMPENLMMKADKILMAHSLEGRFPFLDNDVMAFASTLPQDYKIKHGDISKWILKKTVRHHLPAAVINRPKMGFSVPVDRLLIRMKDLVLTTLSEARTSEIAEIVNMKRVTQLASDFYGGDGSKTLQLWSLFVLLHWHQEALPKYKSIVRLPARATPTRFRKNECTTLPL